MEEFLEPTQFLNLIRLGINVPKVKICAMSICCRGEFFLKSQEKKLYAHSADIIWKRSFVNLDLWTENLIIESWSYNYNHTCITPCSMSLCLNNLLILPGSQYIIFHKLGLIS
jgi:hypothetical protein